jgi:hypothetical protein
MEMVGQQGPGVTFRPGFNEESGKTIDQVLPVLVVAKDVAPFYPTNDYMLKDTGNVNSRETWHERENSKRLADLSTSQLRPAFCRLLRRHAPLRLTRLNTPAVYKVQGTNVHIPCFSCHLPTIALAFPPHQESLE